MFFMKHSVYIFMTVTVTIMFCVIYSVLLKLVWYVFFFALYILYALVYLFLCHMCVRGSFDK